MPLDKTATKQIGLSRYHEASGTAMALPLLYICMMHMYIYV